MSFTKNISFNRKPIIALNINLTMNKKVLILISESMFEV